MKQFYEYQTELKCLQSVNRELDDRCLEYKQEIAEKNELFKIEVAELNTFLIKKD